MEEIVKIQGYYESNEQYPIPFEEFWQWVGYSRKDVAKRTLENNFSNDVDFNLRRIAEVQIEGSRKVKREKEYIFLTIDCAKSFAMLAQTVIGRKVRQYFLECEKQLREIQKTAFASVAVFEQLEARLARLEKQHKQLKRYVNKEIDGLCEALLPFVDSMQELKGTTVDEARLKRIWNAWIDELVDLLDEVVFLPLKSLANKTEFLETVLQNFTGVVSDEKIELVKFYAFREGESSLHKLGISAEVDMRKVNLSTGNSQPLHNVLTIGFYSRRLAKSFESHIHEFFRRKQERHEWFNLSFEDLAFIEQLGLLYQAYQQRIFANVEGLPAR